MIDERQVNGSQEIIRAILNLPHVQDSLEKRWSNDCKSDKSCHDVNLISQNIDVMSMKQFYQSESARRWTRFATDELAPLLYPNLCGSLSDSYSAFGYVERVSSFSFMQKVMIRSLGALAMFFAASKVKCKSSLDAKTYQNLCRVYLSS